MIITKPETRRYLYGVVAAAIPILVLFGLIGPDDVTLWLYLAAAVLGLATPIVALPNTNQTSPGGSLDPASQASAPVVNVNLSGGVPNPEDVLEEFRRRDRIAGPDHRA